jgi:hypothetical protein
MAITLKRQLSENEKDQIIGTYGRVCFATGHDISADEPLHFDRIHAFAECGTTELNNIAPMCEQRMLFPDHCPIRRISQGAYASLLRVRDNCVPSWRPSMALLGA